MTELLHVAALLPAALGVCCTAGRRRATPELATAVVMLVVMADLALGIVSVPPVVWTAVLVATALIVASGSRRRGSRTHPAPDDGGTRPGRAIATVAPTHAARAMTVTTATGALVMAGLASLMTAAGPGRQSGATSAVASGHHSGSLIGGVLPGVVILAAVVYTGVVVWGIVRGVRERRGRLETAERASMATSVVLMALAVAV